MDKIMSQHFPQLSSGLTRRRALEFAGSMATVMLLGCARRPSAALSEASESSAVQIASTMAVPGCVVRPEQTEGPYFVDERLNRSDVRSNPADGAVKPGVPLRLVFQVAQVSGNSCTPLHDAIVDIWHCDATGIYSDVNDRRIDTVGQKFLRGYQTTNAEGLAEFLTIYPGAYPGRAVHIHFKIRTMAGTQAISEFTSQLYFDDALTDRVHGQAPYPGGQRTRNQQDRIFQQGGDQLLLKLAEADTGYRGRFEIGLALS